jgi:pimeloyl-ACP methyl ester carboxylesterase
MTAASGSLAPIHWHMVSDHQSWELLVWPGPTAPPAPRFLLIHGLGATPAYFQPLAALLSANGVVYAPALPGFGGTARLPGTQTTEAIARAVANLCVTIGEGPYVIVGHSLGCQIAARLCARFPDIASGLVLLAPAPDPSAGPLICQALALAVDVAREPFALIRLMLPAMLTAGPRYLLTAIWAMRRYHWQDDLEVITAPALVIRGGRDPLVSHRWDETVARLIPNARLVEVAGAPHGVNFTDPGPIAEAIRGLSRDV